MAGDVLSRTELFARDGYLRINQLIRPTLARRLCADAFRIARSDRARTGDRMVPRAPAIYGAPEMDDLVRRLLPSAEKATGLRLYPTYSYLRIYRRGDALPRHHDRPACEISISLMLGHDTTRPWPLWIAGRQGARPVSLQAGDGLVYRGIDCAHWRNRFRGRWQCQVFLHYVDRDGPNASWKYDHRPRLGLPVWRRGEARLAPVEPR